MDLCFGPINFELMHEGKCVMTVNWGNNFKRYLEKGTQLAGRYGVATTPGSPVVLDRVTRQLEQCTSLLCPNARYYEDIGWINQSPYLAFGGWACAVSNYTDSRFKRMATEFCAFSASRQQSILAVIPNATGTGNATQNGQDPFRSSHLDLERYVAHGYERETSSQYISSIRAHLESPNLVTDIRFPTSADIYDVLDREFYAYLYSIKNNAIVESERASRRREVTRNITMQWLDIISGYDEQSSTVRPLLEAYQRLNNVYQPQVEMNQLGGIRGYGIVLSCIIMACSICFAAWTVRYRTSRLVMASQPYFLVMLCFGTAVLGSAIIPLGMDDGAVSETAATRACRSIPWLLSMGWSIVFATLFSKIWRVNIVYRNSMALRRLKVTERDVLLPFAVICSCNLILLSTLAVIDPLYWERSNLSDTESIGSCMTRGSSVAQKTLWSLLGVLNGIALVLANVEAYRARRIATEYGESRYIGMIMASILQVVVVGAPLLFLVNNNPTANYFIRCSIIFVLCMSILLTLFIPKLAVGWLSNEVQRKASQSGTGLRFLITDDPAIVAARAARVDEYKEKLSHLEDIMVERGLDVRDLFFEAGLHEDLSSYRNATVVAAPPPPVVPSRRLSILNIFRGSKESSELRASAEIQRTRRVSFLSPMFSSTATTGVYGVSSVSRVSGSMGASMSFRKSSGWFHAGLPLSSEEDETENRLEELNQEGAPSHLLRADSINSDHDKMHANDSKEFNGHSANDFNGQSTRPPDTPMSLRVVASCDEAVADTDEVISETDAIVANPAASDVDKEEKSSPIDPPNGSITLRNMSAKVTSFNGEDKDDESSIYYVIDA
jgi:hypothetical protein